jgi:hypothetical protein
MLVRGREPLMVFWGYEIAMLTLTFAPVGVAHV